MIGTPLTTSSAKDFIDVQFSQFNPNQIYVLLSDSSFYIVNLLTDLRLDYSETILNLG